ncbi:MAG: GntR family transcriptional regulator [bacterium]|nr:GntR family transcriptional regulator [bacterium]
MLKGQINKIDKTSVLPRYYQVIETIKELIVFGSYKKGDKIPSERNLAELLDVSLITVRRATDELTRQGILIKEWGRGIFVNRIPEDKRKTLTVGLTCWQNGEQYSTHPVQFSIMQGVGEVFLGTNYGLKTVFITPELIQSKKYQQYFTSQKIDGLINIVLEIPDTDLEEIEKHIPYVVHGNRPERINGVSIDMESISYELTKKLIFFGHRNIGVINGPEEFTPNQLWLKGYKKAMEESNLEISKNNLKSADYCCESGYRLACEILAQRKKPTAIICGDDYLAVGCLNAIKKFGLNCPEDIWVFGFGDFPVARYSHPPLSTVKFSYYEMGKQLAYMLIKVIQREKIEAPVILTGEIIFRESAGHKE